MPGVKSFRICIYGAGAVGGNFAVRLASAGHTVSVVARGQHLKAIQENGLTLISGDQSTTARVAASNDPSDLGPQDLVITTLKAHSLVQMAERIEPLLTETTPVVFAQNGIPWWYGHGLDSSRPPSPDLELLNEPVLRTILGMDRVIGGVIHSSNDVSKPGIVRNNSPRRNRLVIGEVDDQQTDRIVQLRAVLADAGIDSPPSDDLRSDIWNKLISNMRVSLLSFLVERTSREVFDDPDIRPIIDRLGEEGVAIADAHGIACTIDSGGPSPGHRSSMLQDYEQGREQEVAALVTAPQLFARSQDVATPTFDTIAGLVRSKAAHPPGR